MKLQFLWIAQEAKFHFELRQPDGQTVVAMWMTVTDVVNLFNTILAELRRAASNPESLPKPLRLTDPAKAATDKILEELQKKANGDEDFN